MSTLSGDSVQHDNSIPRLIAGLFVLLGIGILLVLVLNVGGSEDIARARATGDLGQVILEFLYTFGIISPLLMLGAGLAFLNFARKLNAKDLLTAKWATQTLFWLMVFCIIGSGVHTPIREPWEAPKPTMEECGADDGCTDQESRDH